jgi:hypothetical protein
VRERVQSRAGAASGRLGQAALGGLLAAFLLSVYVLSYSGTFRVDDEHILAARSQSLALWGRLTDTQVYGNARVRELAALGDQATQIEPGQSILGALFYRMAVALGVGGVQALFTLNIYVTALTAVVVFATVLSLGYKAKVAAWCAFLFGVGSMAWPYATTFYRDPLAMLMTALAFLGWALAIEGNGGARVWGIALLVGGLVGGSLTKNTVAAMAPAFALGAVAIWLGELRAGRRISPAGALLLAGGAMVVLVLVIMPKTGPLSRFSLEYYSSLARHFEAGLSLHFASAIAGPFLSPAKSIFIFSPPLLLAVPGSLRSWSSRWKFAMPALLGPLLIAGAQGLFYREGWAGGYGWGLRFMLPALPPLMVLAAPIVERLLERGAWRGAVLYALLGIGVCVQLSGAWVKWDGVYSTWTAQGLDPYSPGAAWSPAFLAIPGQVAGLLRLQTWSVAWIRVVNAVTPEVLIVPVGACLVGLLALVLLLQRGASRRTGFLGWAVAVCVLVSVLVPVFPTLDLYRDDPALGGGRPEFEGALAWLEAEIEPQDVVVMDSYGTALWAFLMNRWREPVRWYSLPFEIPGSPGVDLAPGGRPSEEAVALFEQLGMNAGRLWYLTSQDAPDYGLGREVAWLEGHYQCVVRKDFAGATVVELRAYETRFPVP